MFGAWKLKHRLIALVALMRLAQIGGAQFTSLLASQQGEAEAYALTTKFDQMHIEHANQLVHTVASLSFLGAVPLARDPLALLSNATGIQIDGVLTSPPFMQNLNSRGNAPGSRDQV